MTRRIGAVLSLLFVVFVGLPLVPASAATATVTIGSSLSPASLTVAPGTTVTWRNADSERHRVRTTSAPVELDSNDLDPGQSWSFTFRTAGTYRYVDHRDEDDSAYWGTVTVSSSSGGGSGGGGSTGGGGSAGGGAAGGGTTSPAPPSSGTVTMAGRAFSPSSIRVAAGGTITFSNNDDRAHTVTASDGSFDSGVVNGGGRYARRFASAGTFRYFCQIHTDMTGTVVVPTASGSVPAPRPAAPKPPASGSGAGAGAGGGSAAVPPGPGRPGSARVNVVDFAFTPARLSVHVGDTVSWVNTGQSPHTVTAANGAFGTSMLAAGATYRTTVRAVGTVSYVCAFHPQMTGVLAVLPAAAALPAPVAAAAPPRIGAGAGPAPAAISSAAPSPAMATGVAAPSPSASPRATRAVASTSRWPNPLVAWTLWAGVGLVAFLSVAWWRGRAPV
jgi:plastocyanin